MLENFGKFLKFFCKFNTNCLKKFKSLWVILGWISFQPKSWQRPWYSYTCMMQSYNKTYMIQYYTSIYDLQYRTGFSCREQCTGEHWAGGGARVPGGVRSRQPRIVRGGGGAAPGDRQAAHAGNRRRARGEQAWPRALATARESWCVWTRVHCTEEVELINLILRSTLT